MKLKLHTYSGGQMVLAFETENECEKNLVKFFYGESASLDKRQGVTFNGIDTLMIEQDKKLKK